MIESLPKEVPKGTPKGIPKGFPKGFPKVLPKVLPKGLQTDIPKQMPKSLPKEMTKMSKDFFKGFPKGFPKGGPADIPKVMPGLISKPMPKTLPKIMSKDIPKGPPKMVLKGMSQGTTKSFSKMIPKGTLNEMTLTKNSGDSNATENKNSLLHAKKMGGEIIKSETTSGLLIKKNSHMSVNKIESPHPTTLSSTQSKTLSEKIENVKKSSPLMKMVKMEKQATANPMHEKSKASPNLSPSPSPSPSSNPVGLGASKIFTGKKENDISKTGNKMLNKMISKGTFPAKENYLNTKTTTTTTKATTKATISNTNGSTESTNLLKTVAYNINKSVSAEKSTDGTTSTGNVISINHKTENNIMIGVLGNNQSVGPLSTYKESELIRNTHYINAFSRMDGNYVGKVSGPPCPISELDKTPQYQSNKKLSKSDINTLMKNQSTYQDYTNQFMGVPNIDYPNYYNQFNPMFNAYNNPFTNAMGMNPGTDTTMGMGMGMGHMAGMQKNFVPFCFYPGMCVPMVPYDPMAGINPHLNLGELANENDKNAHLGDKKGGKKKKMGNIKKDNRLVAAGHLKPKQFRDGAQWSSEDEQLLNEDVRLKAVDGFSNSNQNTRGNGDIYGEEDSDISSEDGKRKKRKEKKKEKVRTIGDSHWYEIERRLNNARGVINTDEAEEEEEEEEKHKRKNHRERGEQKGKNKNRNKNHGKKYTEEDLHEHRGREEYSSSATTSDDIYSIIEEKKRQNKKKQREKKYRNRIKKYRASIDTEESTDAEMDRNSADDLYKNYKASYLKEKMKWANEYMNKNKNQLGNKNRNVPINYKPLKKSKIKGLNDVANLLLPHNKKYQTASTLAGNMSKLNIDDQNDVINLLMSCRDLEKLIEEQHCVLDMLDNDLKEVNSTLKLAPTWDLFENIDLLNEKQIHSENKTIPIENTPLFIKGKVAFVPKDLQSFFNENEKMPPETSTFTKPGVVTSLGTHKSALKNETPHASTDSAASRQTSPMPEKGPQGLQKNIKFVPKLAKPKMKAKLPIPLRKA